MTEYRTVIVTGSRDHTAPEIVYRELRHEQSLAVSAGAKLFVAVGDCPTGVDAAVRRWCRTNLLRSCWREYIADWKHLGKRAGPARNRTMVGSHPDAAVCLAFPLCGPRFLSKGTWGCHDAATAIGIATRVVYPDPADG